MSNLEKLTESFKMKYEAFITGCDSVEELELWDKETFGEMDGFYSNDLISIIIRLIASDGIITQNEVDYLNKTFDVNYSLEELKCVYNDCKENFGESFDQDFENGIERIKKVNEKLANAYKELINLVCEIIIESDGVISAIELNEVDKLKELCK